MEDQTETDAIRPGLFLPDPARRDVVKAYAIEIAVSIVGLVGARQAATFLRKYSVDIEVALRVLLHPSQRRSYDGRDKFAMDGMLEG